VYVESLDQAPDAARLQIEEKLGGPLTAPRTLALDDFPRDSAARDWLTEARANQGDAGDVVVLKTDAIPVDAKPAIDAYLAENDLAAKDAAVVRIGKVEGADEAQTQAARDWLRRLRGQQKDTGLLVLSVSDTHVLKQVRKFLLRKGVKEDEIAMVFSDAEYLRNNVPKAEVKKQMNLDALAQGRARVLILDTRVGGRGLDLEFKGGKGFRGYTDFEMVIVDPQKMSQVHLLQAEGRIDTGRVLPSASRNFSLLMDVRSVQDEAVFRDMVRKSPFFNRILRSDPQLQEFARARGAADMDWTLIQDYMQMRAADGTADGARLVRVYRRVVKRYLERQQQAEIEKNQLRSSSVLQEPMKGNSLYPGLEKAQ
jgi:hypothetical protein